ncbi:MAG: FAD binding domain-containing protein [Spirochaetota bacterium]
MYKGVRAPAVFSPETLGELLEVYRRYPKSIIWAGGTSIMSQLRPYPTHDNQDILYLGNVKEFGRITRTERYIEAGCMVSVGRLLTIGQHILPKILASAARDIGPAMIRNQTTLGGNLCHPRLRLNLASALLVLDTQVEIKDSRATKNTTRWVPIQKLYRRDGSLALIQGELVTKVRIFFEQANFQLFRTLGHPFFHPEQAVIFTVFAKHEKSTISEFRFSLTYPKIDVIRSREIENLITSKDLPLTTKEIVQISHQVRDIAKGYSTKISGLQVERTCRIMEHALQTINIESLSRR